MHAFRLPLRRGPRPATLGFALYFCAGFADGTVVPFFPLWAQGEAGIPVGFIGFLFGCYAGGELLATPFIGGIADRIGRRPVLLLSCLGVGGGFVLLSLAHSVVGAAAALLFIGVSESVLHPTIATVIAETTPAAEHRRQFSLARVSSSLGRVLGPAAGAALARLSLGSVFVAAGAALLAGCVLAAAWLPETLAAGSGEDDGEEDGLAALLPAFTDRRLAMLLLWFMSLEVGTSWIEAVLPLYAHDAAAVTASGVGLLFTYGAALVALGQLPLTRLTGRRSALWLVFAAGGSLVAAFGILLVGPAFAASVAAVTLFALSQMLTGPLVMAAVNRLAPAKRRAAYMAASSVASDLRDSLGPATGTALYALSAPLPWIAGIPVVAVAALGLGTTIARQDRAT